MKGCWVSLLSAILVMFLLTGPAVCSGPPFPISLEIGKTQGEQPGFKEIVSKLRVLLHSYPYLLDRYLQTADVVFVREIYKNTDTLDKYLDLMPKTVKDNRQKEMFAKVMAGSQKLKENVRSNLHAIDSYRLSAGVFTKQSSKLVEWLRVSSVKLSQASWNSNSSPKKPTPSILFDRMRAETLRAIFAAMLSLSRTYDEAQMNKAAALWNSALKAGAAFTASAVTPDAKELAQHIKPTLTDLRSQSKTLFMRSDELRRSLDSALSQINSLEELLVGVRPAKAPAKGDTNSPADQKR